MIRNHEHNTPERERARDPEVEHHIDAFDDHIVGVFFRPPRAGERGWYVREDASPAKAWAMVVDGMEGAGAHEYGWSATYDYPHFDEDDDRVVTVIVEEAGAGDDERMLASCPPEREGEVHAECGMGEPFCACGRRWSDCDGSRAKCHRNAGGR